MEDVSSRLIQSFVQSVEDGDASSVAECISRSPRLATNVISFGQTAIHIAMRQRRLDVALELLNRNVEIEIRNAFGFTPLHIAAEIGFLDGVGFLFDHGADPEPAAGEKRITPLYLAALQYVDENLRVVEYLRDHGATLDLHSAILLGDLAAVFDIIAADETAVVNSIDRDLLLHHTIDLRHKSIGIDRVVKLLKTLLVHGACVNYPQNWTPVLWKAVASSDANAEIVKTLLDFGAIAGLKDDSGTLLEDAEELAPPDVAKLIRKALGR